MSAACERTGNETGVSKIISVCWVVAPSFGTVDVVSGVARILTWKRKTTLKETLLNAHLWGEKKFEDHGSPF